MKSFNINEYVYVKLTQEGKNILYNNINRFSKLYLKVDTSADKIVEAYKVGEYYKFQLHDFINIFSSYITFGSIMPFEGGNLYFNEEDFK